MIKIEAISIRMKVRRQRIGKTLSAVAQDIGVSEATVQRYESGAIKAMKYSTIVALSESLNCSPTYLMGWDEDPVPKPALPEEAKQLIRIMDELNEEGKERLIEYGEDLVAGGRYKKTDPAELVQKKA